MKNKLFAGCCVMFLLLSCGAFGVSAQKNKKAVKTKVKPIIFAVLNDGKTLEPIAHIEKNKLTAPVNGSDDAKLITGFTTLYYKTKPAYRLIFGGVDDGTATVKSFDPNSDCAKNMAEITSKATKARFKPMIMALATNAPTKKTAGVRRLPTATERAAIETLVRAEFAQKGVATTAIKTLNYHNLTALDVNADGKAELVGSYWVAPTTDERALLFFIAEKGTDGDYVLGHSDFSLIKKSEVMSEEISALDNGTLNELLLDVYDFDGDGTSEVFSYVQSFEGASFNVYGKRAGKWTNIFEGSNYHCAF